MTLALPLGHELEAEWRFRIIHDRTGILSMEMSLFDIALSSLKGVGVSKRRTQAGTLVLRLMGRPATSSAVSCVGLKRPCTGPCLEGIANKDISMLF